MSGQDTSSDESSHTPGSGKGEEKSAWEGKEAGLHEEEDSHADRPSGSSTARASTSINPKDRDPIDPNSPNMPPA